MFEIQTQLFGASFESVFKKPVPLHKSKILEIAERVSETLSQWGAKPASLKLRKGDALFDYELSADLFGGNATFSLNAEKMVISFSNGRTQADLTAVVNSLDSLYKSVQLSNEHSTIVTIYAHSIFESITKRSEFFSQLQVAGAKVPLSGLVAYFKLDMWNEEIRLQIDRSNAFPAGIFLHWTTTFPPIPINTEKLIALYNAMLKVCESCQLKFIPMK